MSARHDCSSVLYTTAILTCNSMYLLPVAGIHGVQSQHTISAMLPLVWFANKYVVLVPPVRACSTTSLLNVLSGSLGAVALQVAYQAHAPQLQDTGYAKAIRS